MTTLRSLTIGVLVVLLSALALACASEDDPQQRQSAVQLEQQDVQREQQQGQQPGQQQGQQSDDRQQQTVRVQSGGSDQQMQGDQQQDAEQTDAEQTQTAAAPTSSEQQPDQQAEHEQGQQQAEQRDQQQALQQGESQQDERQPSVEQAQSDPPESQQEAQPEAQQQEQASQPAEPRQRDQLTLRAEEILARATAPELTGLNGWLNGEETSISLELAKGNVVLIDFWTYTCINCVRTLPFLTAWDAKYRDHGLVILGVHTPEFEFEKLPANINAAIAEHGIEYDVPIDNDYRTWRAFRNRYWPAKYLIGPTDDGSPMGIRYFHFGEGHYEETELEIRAALEAVGRDLSDVPIGVDASVPTRESGNPRQTRELYAGWSRNTGSGGPYAGQETYFLAGPNVPTLYRDVETDERQHNLWYLEGLWTTERQAIIHARETKNLEDYMALLVRGRTANVVLTVAEDGNPYDVYVQWDGDWLDRSIAAEHIKWDADGRSFIRVTENDLYRLIFLPEFGEGELILRSDSDQFRMFAFTFGAYVGGE